MVTKEKKSSVKAVKKIHVKIQPLLAVAYHDAIIQWVEILSEKTFLFFFCTCVIYVFKNYLGKLGLARNLHSLGSLEPENSSSNSSLVATYAYNTYTIYIYI